MEYLARAIVDFVSLFKEILTVWAKGGNNVTAQDEALLGDSLSSVFVNIVNFVAELTAELTRQMANIAS